MGFAEVSKFDANPHATFYAQRDPFQCCLWMKCPWHLTILFTHNAQVEGASFINAQSSCALSVPVQPKHTILFIDFNYIPALYS